MTKGHIAELGFGLRRRKEVNQTRRAFLAAGVSLPTLARNWDQPAFPAWSDEFVDKILTDSPWARSFTSSFKFSAEAGTKLRGSSFAQIGEPLGLPGGWPKDQRSDRGAPRINDGPAPAVQTEIYLTTRWSSAEPVRQALALHQYGRAGLQSDRAQALLRGTPGEYIVEIAGFPAGMVPQGVRKFQEQLLDSATLMVKSRKPIHATSADVPEHGNHLIATLRFRRFEDLSAMEGVIELSAKAGHIAIRQNFKLRDMQYKSRLEL